MGVYGVLLASDWLMETILASDWLMEAILASDWLREDPPKQRPLLPLKLTLIILPTLALEISTRKPF